MRESSLTTRTWPATPVEGARACTAGVAILSLMFLGVAFWNGFPIIFYDTGAYVLQGLGHVFMVERSPVYAELLFLTGGAFSLWPIVVVQTVLTSYIILETARAEIPGLTLAGLAGIGAVLTLLTGIAWYAGQVEPDCFTPLVILGCWLILFRSERMGKLRTRWVAGITGLAVACHPSHLGLVCGLLLCAVVLKLLSRRNRGLPAPRLKHGVIVLATALAMIVAGNFVLTGKFFISKSGSVFVFARLMQDGIVKRLMDETCPPNGSATYKLCGYKAKLDMRADAWLWGPSSNFRELGGFTGTQQQAEDRRIIIDSLQRYPFTHLRAATFDSIVQFLMFRTGDGIEPQEWVLGEGFRRIIPHQVPAYLGARQQQGLLRFKTLNLIHVPVGAMSVLGLLLLIQHAGARRDWRSGAFAALVLLGLIGNAIICGTFSNPHDRYQSRVIWLPTLVLLLAVVRDRRALQPVPESGT
jgi:hypothetical protein